MFTDQDRNMVSSYENIDHSPFSHLNTSSFHPEISNHYLHNFLAQVKRNADMVLWTGKIQERKQYWQEQSIVFEIGMLGLFLQQATKKKVVTILVQNNVLAQCKLFNMVFLLKQCPFPPT